MSPSSRFAECCDRIPRAELARILLWLLGIKVVFLLLDPNLRLFMGDSASYLHAARGGWNPPDRSITYPELVAWSAIRAQSAFALVVLQSLMGVAGCMLVYWMLRGAARRSARTAGWAAGLIAVEPTQLFYERMLMAESAGLLALLGTVAATVASVRGGRLRWALVVAVLGMLTVSFRMSLLPVVLGLAAITPVLRFWHLRDACGETPVSERLFATLRYGAVLGVAVLGSHQLYQHAYGARMDVDPTYLAAEGKMRIALVAPLIRPRHFEHAGLPADFAETLPLPLNDHHHREAQIWSQDGLWAHLERRFGEARAERIARELTAAALESDPMGLPRLGGLTLVDYFDDSIAIPRLQDDFGRRPPDDGTLDALAAVLRYQARDLAGAPGLVGHAFLASRWWLTSVLFLLAPVAVACLVLAGNDPRRGAVARVLGFAALGLVASHFLFSHIVSFRYLHPMPVFLIACGALMLGSRARGPRFRRRR